MPRKRILIVDDDKALARLLANRCRDLRLHAAVAYDALSALNRLNEFQPHVVVLDIGMPAGNGLSVCEMMMFAPHWRSIPKIVLTGRTDSATILRCHELLAHYVPKKSDTWEILGPLLVELLQLSPLSNSRWQSGAVLEGLVRDTHQHDACELVPSFEMDELVARCLGDIGFAERMILRFQRQAPLDCEQLAAFIASGNCPEIATIAHHMRGAAMYVAARYVHETATMLESFALKNDLAKVVVAFESLQAHVIRCVRHPAIHATCATN